MGAADAWLRAHTAFVDADPGTTLLVTPAGPADATLLTNVREAIGSALESYAGHPPDAGSAALRLSLAPPTNHPDNGERRDALRQTILMAERRATAGDDREALGRLADLLDRSRLGAASSFHGGPYDLFAVPGLSRQEQEENHALIYRCSALIWDSLKGARRNASGDWTSLNNWSPCLSLPSVDDILALGLKTVAVGTAARPSVTPTVGVIVPGGRAASGDVLGQLELEGSRIDLRVETVPRGTAALNRAMQRAVDSIHDHAAVSIIVGYGGGAEAELDAVVDALLPELEFPHQPMYVGIGHVNYGRRAGSEKIRWCATPTAAAALFRAEALAFPRQVAEALQDADSGMRNGFGRPDRLAEVRRRLKQDLDRVDSALSDARSANLQP